MRLPKIGAYLRAEWLGEFFKAFTFFERAQTEQTATQTKCRWLIFLFFTQIGQRTGLDCECNANLQFTTIFVLLLFARFTLEFERAGAGPFVCVHFEQWKCHLAEELVHAEIVAVQTCQHKFGTIAVIWNRSETRNNKILFITIELPPWACKQSKTNIGALTIHILRANRRLCSICLWSTFGISLCPKRLWRNSCLYHFCLSLGDL